jgi:hypothetical protein
MPRNNDPTEPWNQYDKDDPRAPWNDPVYDDESACWNNEAGQGNYRDKL